MITWPTHVTECSPAKLGEVISNAARILGNASTELAAINAGWPHSRRTSRNETVWVSLGLTVAFFGATAP